MEKWASGEGEGKEKFLVPHPPPHQPSLVKYLITIQDGSIESLIYLAFRSKITAALQAKVTRTPLTVVAYIESGLELPP